MEYEKKAKWIVLLSLVLLLFLTGCTALGVVNKTSSEIPLTGMQLSYADNGQFTIIGEAFDLDFARPVWLEGDNSKTDRIIESNLNEYSYGGIYKAAYFSDIATYPDKFPY